MNALSRLYVNKEGELVSFLLEDPSDEDNIEIKISGIVHLFPFNPYFFFEDLE